MELYKKMMIKYKGDFKYDISKEPYNKSLASIYRIPHFYSGNFYVYKYAIGEMVAQYASKKISTDKKFISQYFNFLSSGNSKSPLETIKILGFEFNKKSNDFIKKGIEEILKEF
jgi:oligoendopeptidase F